MNQKVWPLGRNLVAFSAGFLFAVGLASGGMTQPSVVLNFLNLLTWDPTLLFVMAGALIVFIPIYQFSRKRKHPFFDSEFHLPENAKVTRQLIAGSAIFGIGWGLGGYCPGPAVASLASGSAGPAIFVVSMIVGFFLYKVYLRFN